MHDSELLVKGITPIYMGSTTPRYSWVLKEGDHPHIHGEHREVMRRYRTLIGSPPYTWGAPQFYQLEVKPQRITPIYMGSTQELNIPFDPSVGSPPYTWGALNPGMAVAGGNRITPIYMGSTRVSKSTRSANRDHPHIHGEHLKHDIHG